ncbi:DinB family protein [Cohnella yongneupensis]|uniref:DinB family protein n=1 Tax=Cohnella yongneupensis TaxID=425006 RepID=A0ABW0R107_9BACL
MSDPKRVIESFSTLIAWADRLNELDDATWFKPLAEGKASIAEVISHLLYWDRYFITNVVLAAVRGEEIAYPDFDPFNAEAYKYAKSGISRKQLLWELSATRAELCRMLLALGEGMPSALAHTIQESTDHDLHHRNQIDGILNQR